VALRLHVYTVRANRQKSSMRFAIFGTPPSKGPSSRPIRLTAHQAPLPAILVPWLPGSWPIRVTVGGLRLRVLGPCLNFLSFLLAQSAFKKR